MEKIQSPGYTFATKNYYLLTKPGIIMGNVITTAGGFSLASKGYFNPFLFLATLLGISFIIASACVFNNYIDRHHDEKMLRTKNRALAKGLISGQNAILFALILGAIGIAVMYSFTNLLTLSLALIGFFVYVFLYSFSKYKTVHGTLIGSIAGAIPPTVGYCAVSNHFDLGALLLFSMIVFWQMPHFYAISIQRLKDYKAANIPVLPAKKGLKHAKIEIILYIILFAGVTSLFTFFGYTNKIFLTLTLGLSSMWLGLAIKGLYTQHNKKWAREMFVFSLVVVLLICLALPFTQGAVA